MKEFDEAHTEESVDNDSFVDLTVKTDDVHADIVAIIVTDSEGGPPSNYDLRVQFDVRGTPYNSLSIRRKENVADLKTEVTAVPVSCTVRITNTSGSADTYRVVVLVLGTINS